MAGNDRFNATSGKVSLTTLTRTGILYLKNTTNKTINIINVEVTVKGSSATDGAQVILVADSTTGAGTIGTDGTAIDPGSVCLLGQTDTQIDAKVGADAITCPAGVDLYHDYVNIEDMNWVLNYGHSFAVAVLPDAACDVYVNVHYEYK